MLVCSLRGDVMREIEAGFVTFTEVTEAGDHRAYNEWHQLDHLPEQFRIPGIVFGQRWVLAPSCAAVQVAVADPLPAFHYVTLYLMTAPLAETLEQFTAVRERLTEVGRFYAHRRTALSGAWRFLQAWAAPRVLVAPEVVPFRPTTGVYVIVEEPGPGYDRRARWVQESHVPSLLQVPGVAGVWWLGPRLWAFGPTGPSPAAPAGEDAIRITIVFLDGDPVTAAGAIAPLVAERWEDGALRARFAGPCLGITPWEWDWFA
jgi:hypothetical protein